MPGGNGEGGRSSAAIVAPFVAEILGGMARGPTGPGSTLDVWQRSIEQARLQVAPEMPLAEGLRTTGRAFASAFLLHEVGEALRLRLAAGGPLKAAEVMVSAITRLRTNASSQVVVTGERTQRIEMDGAFVPEFLAGCLEQGFTVSGVAATVHVLRAEATRAELEASW